MPHQAYTTSVYPYPAEMWESAATHLETKRGWATILIVCPNPDEAAATAKQEMADRGLSDVSVLIYTHHFSEAHLMRISKLQYINPRWDAAENALKDPEKKVALVGINLKEVSADAMIIEAKGAMLERGFNVGVGYSSEVGSEVGLLRIELP